MSASALRSKEIIGRVGEAFFSVERTDGALSNRFRLLLSEPSGMEGTTYVPASTIYIHGQDNLQQLRDALLRVLPLNEFPS